MTHRHFLLVLLLTACADKSGVTPLDDTGTPDGDGGATDGDGGGDGGDGGSGDGGSGDGGVEPPDPATLEWTEGPDLPDCTPQVGSGNLVALSGVVLTSTGPEAGVVVYDRAAGQLTCVGADCDTSTAEVVCTDGVISAGLIDTHNHLQYNVIPPWQHADLYDDRYDWQSDGDYWDYREAYDDIEDPYQCEIMRWAELRSLVGGGTAAVGSSGDECIEGLVRNLDESSDEHYLDDYRLYYSSSNVTSRFDEGDGDYYSGELAAGDYEAVETHVAEGIGGSVSDEIDHMFDIGMSGPGQVYVHATDATTRQLAQMAVEGNAIIWSPRSNLDLYQATTRADIAMRLGVPVALGPDWTWSGSMNPAHEASCAVDYLGTRGNPVGDTQLHAMITSEAARVLGLDAWLGSLEPGLRADISVFSWSKQPYRSVLRSDAEDVRLVVVDGDALYGVSTLVESARADADDCEVIDACDAERTLCATSGSSGAAAMTAAELEATLSAALAGTSMPAGLEYAAELHGLWDCDDSFASCDLSTPTDGDEDGDGVADDADGCPGWWDPLQEDLDQDGLGDACDPCPLLPYDDDCAHDPADIDDDGIANDADGCPYDHDPEQADRDDDGTNDACDACPDDPNPPGTGCPSSVDAVRNPDHPDHPSEGSVVELSGLVVTGLNEGAGVYLQDPLLTEWAGIYAYTGSDAGVALGDQVTVVGTYIEYYGLSEISGADLTVTGSGDLPDPLELDPCDVDDDSTLGEVYESMLVRFEDVVVSSSNPDDPSDYGEFEIDSCLRVDDDLYDYGDQPTVGTEYDSIGGVLTYTFSHRKVLPRSATDLVAGR